ncbi:ABC transporter permease subunit [Candidatus Mycoplasma pogonae]
MSKSLDYIDNLIYKPIHENEERLKDLKFENQITIEKHLDKVRKRAVLYQDKNNYLKNKINNLENKIIDIQAKMLLDNQTKSAIAETTLSYKTKAEKLKTKLVQQEKILETKLQNYSQKIKQQIIIFEKYAQNKEIQLAQKITEKNEQILQQQNIKYKNLKLEIAQNNEQYQKALQDLHNQKTEEINAIKKQDSLIFSKQLLLINHKYDGLENKLKLQHQKTENKLLQPVKTSNYLNNFKNIAFYKKVDNSLLNWIFKNKLIFLILIFALIVGSIYPRFFYLENWLNNILQQNVVVGLLAIGMTFIILTGSIDLSVGSTMALSGGIALYLHTTNELSLGLSLIIGLIIALALSLAMGFLSSYGKLQSFIVTLVGLLVFRGILNVVLEGKPVSIRGNEFINFLGNGTILAIPSMVFIFIIVTLILMFILKWTKFGRYVYATGTNKVASKASGIKTKLIITSVFGISGLMIFLASLGYIGNVKSIEPQTGVGYELSAIAAVVLGGTSLSGGKGSIGKTIIGWLLISILNNALVFLRVDSNMQLVFRGVIILLAVLFDNQFNVKSKFVNILTRVRGY